MRTWNLLMRKKSFNRPHEKKYRKPFNRPYSKNFKNPYKKFYNNKNKFHGPYITCHCFCKEGHTIAICHIGEA